MVVGNYRVYRVGFNWDSEIYGGKMGNMVESLGDLFGVICRGRILIGVCLLFLCFR